jgi:hypothetical protein
MIKIVKLMTLSIFIRSQNCCLCFVDIVDSTKITSIINNPEKLGNTMGIFLNKMVTISGLFGVKIITGVYLIFYFPQTPEMKTAISI